MTYLHHMTLCLFSLCLLSACVDRTTHTEPEPFDIKEPFVADGDDTSGDDSSLGVDGVREHHSVSSYPQVKHKGFCERPFGRIVIHMAKPQTTDPCGHGLCEPGDPDRPDDGPYETIITDEFLTCPTPDGGTMTPVMVPGIHAHTYIRFPNLSSQWQRMDTMHQREYYGFELQGVYFLIDSLGLGSISFSAHAPADTCPFTHTFAQQVAINRELFETIKLMDLVIEPGALHTPPQPWDDWWFGARRLELEPGRDNRTYEVENALHYFDFTECHPAQVADSIHDVIIDPEHLVLGHH